MSYRLLITPEGITDIERAAEWYEKQEIGLGADFIEVISEAIHSLLTNPLRHRLRERRRNVRWLITKRFPYKIVYRVKDEEVFVFAVLHTARHERQWERRA